MKKFKNFILFFCIAMLFSVVLFSQNTTNKPLDKQINELELGIKYIKLGDTWREAGDLEKAKNFLSKGYEIVRHYNVPYWIGVYYENMGFLSRDENNTELAIDYLKKAKAIFDKHGKTKDDAGSNKAVDVAIERIEKGGFKNNHSDFEETKKLKEENKTIKEKNVELLAINDSLKVTNKELLTRLDRIEKKLNDWEAKYGAKPGISENNNNKIPPPDNKKNVDDGKKEKIPDPEKQEKKQPPPPYDSKDSLSNNFVNNRYNEFVQKKFRPDRDVEKEKKFEKTGYAYKNENSTLIVDMYGNRINLTEKN